MLNTLKKFKSWLTSPKTRVMVVTKTIWNTPTHSFSECYYTPQYKMVYWICWHDIYFCGGEKGVYIERGRGYRRTSTLSVAKMAVEKFLEHYYTPEPTISHEFIKHP